MFKKNHKKYSVRTEIQIDKEIVKSLKEFPKSTYGVAKAINCDRRTAIRHLEKLKSLGELKTARYPAQLYTVKYWVLDRDYLSSVISK